MSLPRELRGSFHANRIPRLKVKHVKFIMNATLPGFIFTHTSLNAVLFLSIRVRSGAGVLQKYPPVRLFAVAPPLPCLIINSYSVMAASVVLLWIGFPLPIHDGRGGIKVRKVRIEKNNTLTHTDTLSINSEI